MNEQKRDDVGIGIIGGGVRLRTLFKPHPGISVTAICDPHPASIEATLKEFNRSAKIYDRFEDLVRDPLVDWVAIGSWNCDHKRHAIAALEAGKNVFCEKPLATSLADALLIRRAVLESSKVFSYGLVLRYSPFYIKLREILRSGVVGKVVSFEFNETLGFNHGGYIFGNWRRFNANAGSHLLEKCCHDIDLANWMIGSLPVRASSFGNLGFFRPENVGHIARIGRDAEEREAYCTWPGTDQVNPFTSEKDIVDNQVVILQYADGVNSSFHTNCNSGIPERRFYICGTEGAVRANACDGTIEYQRIGFNEEPQKIAFTSEDGHAGGDIALRNSVYDSMLNGTAPFVGIDEALKSAIVCFGIDRALSEGCVVDLRPLWNEAGISFRELSIA